MKKAQQQFKIKRNILYLSIPFLLYFLYAFNFHILFYQVFLQRPLLLSLIPAWLFSLLILTRSSIANFKITKSIRERVLIYSIFITFFVSYFIIFSSNIPIIIALTAECIYDSDCCPGFEGLRVICLSGVCDLAAPPGGYLCPGGVTTTTIGETTTTVSTTTTTILECAGLGGNCQSPTDCDDAGKACAGSGGCIAGDCCCVNQISTSLSQYAYPSSPSEVGTYVDFKCEYLFYDDLLLHDCNLPSGSDQYLVKPANCDVFIDGTKHDTNYEEYGVYMTSCGWYYGTSSLSVGDHNWYCICSQTLYQSRVLSSETYTISGCSSDSDCTDPAKPRCYVSDGICVQCYKNPPPESDHHCKIDDVVCSTDPLNDTYMRYAECDILGETYTCMDCGACFYDEDCKDTCCDNDPDGPGGLGQCVGAGPYAPGSAYLCVVSSPAQWTNCNKNNVKTVIEDNGNKYTCIVENGNYMWIEGDFTKTPQYSLIDLFVQIFQKILSYF